MIELSKLTYTRLTPKAFFYAFAKVGSSSACPKVFFSIFFRYTMTDSGICLRSEIKIIKYNDK
jgi:hypothetical protein